MSERLWWCRRLCIWINQSICCFNAGLQYVSKWGTSSLWASFVSLSQWCTIAGPGWGEVVGESGEQLAVLIVNESWMEAHWDQRLEQLSRGAAGGLSVQAAICSTLACCCGSREIRQIAGLQQAGEHRHQRDVSVCRVSEDLPSVLNQKATEEKLHRVHANSRPVNVARLLLWGKWCGYTRGTFNLTSASGRSWDHGCVRSASSGTSHQCSTTLATMTSPVLLWKSSWTHLKASLMVMPELQSDCTCSHINAGTFFISSTCEHVPYIHCLSFQGGGCEGKRSTMSTGRSTVRRISWWVTRVVWFFYFNCATTVCPWWWRGRAER